jgi:DNA mismatch repair ATPase MutS
MMFPSLLYNDKATHHKNLMKNSDALIADLNLMNIFTAMAQGDSFIFRAAKEVLLNKETCNVNTIVFRQEILSDSFQNDALFHSLYNELSMCINQYETYYKKSLPSFSTFITVTAVVKDNVVLLRILFNYIQKIKEIIDKNNKSVVSSGVRVYFDAFNDFFSDRFLICVNEYLHEIETACDQSCTRLTASLGGGLKGNNYVLRSIRGQDSSKNHSFYSSTKNNEIFLSSIGIQAQAGSLRDAGLSQISRILRQVNEKTLAYLKSFRYDIGFYAGCINMHLKMQEYAVPISFPKPMEMNNGSLVFSNLVDASLAIENTCCPVGNSLNLDGCKLLIVTGANQGGKSTYLRSVGCAQLMMQCGLFVCAESYSAACVSSIFTHFCRSESVKLDQGRLNEELSRINEIVESIDRDSMVLMNESFSSTSECEASNIAQEVIQAFYDLDIRTIYVTHFFDFAKIMEEKCLSGTQFLVAQRNEDGTRPFTLLPSSPKQTSFGMDIYHEIFGD